MKPCYDCKLELLLLLLLLFSMLSSLVWLLLVRIVWNGIRLSVSSPKQTKNYMWNYVCLEKMCSNRLTKFACHSSAGRVVLSDKMSMYLVCSRPIAQKHVFVNFRLASSVYFLRCLWIVFSRICLSSWFKKVFRPMLHFLDSIADNVKNVRMQRIHGIGFVLLFSNWDMGNVQ